MNRALFMASMRSRIMLPVAALAVALLYRLLHVTMGSREWVGSEFQWMGYGLCFCVLGSAMAALLGAELAGGASESSSPAWLLARPVSRGRLLAVRAAADLATLIAVALVLLVVLNPDSGERARGAWMWIAAPLLWLVAHGVTAWAGGMGLSSLGALAVGVVWAMAGVTAGLGAVVAGMGLAGYHPLEVTIGPIVQFITLTAEKPPTLLDYTPLLGIGLGAGFATLWGWRAAVAGAHLTPRALPWKREVSRAAIALGVIALLAGGASVAAGRSLPRPVEVDRPIPARQSPPPPAPHPGSVPVPPAR